jgi:molybdenum cofactor cytidylyltransferase
LNSGKLHSSVVILAAGLSTRMAEPKYALRFNEHQNFLEKIISDFIDFGTDQLIVVLNSESLKVLNKQSYPENVFFIENPFPEKGRLYSLKLGLDEVMEDHPVFIHNVDNPFISLASLTELHRNLKPDSFCVPVFESRGGHPILISSEIKIELLKIDDESISLKKALKKHIRINVNVNDEGVLMNINTAEDYLNHFD